MSVLKSQSLQPDFIKLRWLEPYTSAGLNRKTFKSTPRGVYSGFGVQAVSGNEVMVCYGEDVYGQVTGFSEGAFDPSTSGWSVAVHNSLQGYSTTVAILEAPDGSNNFTFDLASDLGKTVFIALDVQYQVGFGSSAQIKVVEAADLDLDPTLINLARVDVPLTGGIFQANIIFDDAVYPRNLPFANHLQWGYMSKFQAELLNEIGSVSGAPAFTYEYLVSTKGPQTVSLPPGVFYTVNGQDLWVFRNGLLVSSGSYTPTYKEVNRGDGYGETIQWLGDLQVGDVIKFRVQAYASVLSSTVQVFDQGALISQNAYLLNFTGPGVTVLPDGSNRVKIIIPGGGGGGATRAKFNYSPSTIPIYSAVALLSNNSIRVFDTSVSGESFYGITTQTIPNGAQGNVQCAGIVSMAGMGIDGNIGDDVYISQNNDGTLVTADQVSVSGGLVLRVGKLDADDNSATPQDILLDRGRMA